MARQERPIEPGDLRRGGAGVEMRLHPVELGGVERGLRLQHAQDVGLSGIEAGALAFVRLALQFQRRGRGLDARTGGLDSYRQQSGWNNYAELRLSFPLGFRESEANLRSAYRARRQAELRLADVRQNLVFTARASWRELEAARARVDAATSSLELQRKSYEGERARYDAGQSDVLRVLQAQAALDSAQLNWVQSHLDARAASAKVARLDGSILPRHGFTMDAVEAKIGAGLGSEDPLPPLTSTP